MKRLTLYLLMLFSVIGFSGETTFNRMVVFGDSLSDTGNLYKYTFHLVPKSPPYFSGHFSNGRVWAEDVASEWHGNDNALKNYAVGGAGAILSKDEVLPYTLYAEVSSYLGWADKDD